MDKQLPSDLHVLIWFFFYYIFEIWFVNLWSTIKFKGFQYFSSIKLKYIAISQGHQNLLSIIFREIFFFVVESTTTSKNHWI